MIHLLLVSRERNTFKKFEAAFRENNITAQWAGTAKEALDSLSKENFDLFITEEQLPDMTGKELIETVLSVNAMMNCVVLSELSHKDFHETYEGFGVLMQFPLIPGEKEVRNLLDHLNRIAHIAGPAGKPKGE